MFSPGKPLSSVREPRRQSGRGGGCEHCPPSLVTFGARRGRVYRCRPSPSVSDPVRAVTRALPHVAPPPDRETSPLVDSLQSSDSLTAMRLLHRANQPPSTTKTCP